MLREHAGILCEAKVHYWVSETGGLWGSRDLQFPGAVALFRYIERSQTGINERDSTRGTSSLAAQVGENTRVPGSECIKGRRVLLSLGCNTVLGGVCTTSPGWPPLLHPLLHYCAVLRADIGDWLALWKTPRRIEARKLEIMIADGWKKKKTRTFRNARDWITADEYGLSPIRCTYIYMYEGVWTIYTFIRGAARSHGKGARRRRFAVPGINRKVLSLPACSPARGRTRLRNFEADTHRRVGCAQLMTLADAVWLIKIIADIGVFY